MGSNRFVTRESSNLMVTLASFPAGAALEPHVHDRPTFAVILDGGFDLAFTSPGIRRKLHPSPAGSIFTEPAGEEHSNQVGSTAARVLVIQPDVEAAELPTRCMALLNQINHFRDGPISAAAHRCAREFVLTDDLTSLALEGLGLQILMEAARVDSKLHHGAAPRWLQQAIEFIHAHSRHTLRIIDIASVVGVHPAHLAAVFRAVHRMPIATYVRRLRIEWAADRLLSSTDSVAQIAAAAGFSDQAHLTRWFKRITGSTPAAYRRTRRPAIRASIGQHLLGGEGHRTASGSTSWRSRAASQ
ncbi:MAG: helix-turn-helix domain-containing protein [Gemmatimonadales bacterium]